MTLDQVYNLRAGGSWLRNRTIAAIGAYATYLAELGAGATADQQAFVARVLPGANAEIEADFILWAMCFNTDVQTDAEAIADATLRTAVETILIALNRVKAV